MLGGLSAPAAVLSGVLSGVLLLGGCSKVAWGPESATPGAAPIAGCARDSGAVGTPAVSPGASAIVAHGTCRVVAPGADVITLTVLVQVPAPAARAALDGTVNAANAVLGALKRKAVGPRDIRDGSLQVAPVYSPILTSFTGVGGTRLTGFQGSKSITATLRDLAAAGGVISSVVDAAGPAGQIQVNYSVDNPALRAQARASAVRQAQDKAKQMADAAGVPLGQLMSITDVPQSRPAVPPPGDRDDTAGNSAEAVADDGRELDVSVDVVYAVG